MEFASELVVPGGSNLVEGNLVQGGIYVVLGLGAKSVFGLPGLIAVSADSFTKATTGRHLYEHLGMAAVHPRKSRSGFGRLRGDEKMKNEAEELEPLKSSVKLASEYILPGGSNLVEGDFAQGGIHAALGFVARSIFGLPGLIAVSANSFTKATTGRHIHEHLGLGICQGRKSRRAIETLSMAATLT